MIRTLFVLVVGLAIAGCTEQPEDELVGAWFDADEAVSMRLFDNGTIIVEDDFNNKFSGEYHILDAETIRLELAHSDAPAGVSSLIVEYKLSGDTLVFIAPDGVRSTMTRVDP